MDDLGLQKFCDCAGGAGVNVQTVKARLLSIRRRLSETQSFQNEQEAKNIKRYVVAAIADMSYGLEQFASRSINALSGTSYILSAILPRLYFLRTVGPEVLGLASAIFGYFDPDEENTLVEAVTRSFEDFFNSVKDRYVYNQKKNVRDVIVEKRFFLSGMDPTTTTDAEISVLCQVIPASEQMLIFRILEIRIADLFQSNPWTTENLSLLLTYIKLYCQLLSLRLSIACNVYDIIHHASSFNNLSGGYLAAIFEYLRNAKELFSPLEKAGNLMILSAIGPVLWPEIYSFLPTLGIRTNQCADWLVNDPDYPPGAVLAGRTTKGTETFIGRVETQSEILIGQIKRKTCTWIGNVSEGIRIKQKAKNGSDNSLKAGSHKGTKLEEAKSEVMTVQESEASIHIEGSIQGSVQNQTQKYTLLVANNRIDEEDEDETEDEEDSEEEDEDEEEEGDDSILDIPADVRKTNDPQEYRILCVTDPKVKATWRPNVTGVPEGVGALRAGRDTSGQAYFIGRRMIKDNPVIGMVTGTYFLYVTDGQLDYTSNGTKYEVLCLESL